MEVTKEQMNSLQALAATNMKISEAKLALQKLEQMETDYLEKREKKAIQKVRQIVNDSRHVLNEVKNNYQEATELCNTASTLAGFIIEMHDKFLGMVELFDQKSQEWDKNLDLQHKELDEVKREIKLEQIRIERDKKTLAFREKAIREEKALIESRRSQIKSALAVLKKKNGNN